MRSIFLKAFNLCSLVLVLFLSQEVSASLVDDCVVGITTTGSTTVCQGESVRLESTNNFDATSWEWYRVVNGVETALGINAPVLEATIAGDYYVVATGGDCTARYLGVIPVTITPTPNRPTFRIEPTTPICADGVTPVAFIIETPENDVNYTWTFEDGSTQTGTRVEKTFSEQGDGLASTNVSVRGTRGGCQSELVTRSVSVQRIPRIPFTVSWEKEGGETGAGNNYCLAEDEEVEDINIKPVLTIPADQPHSNVQQYFVDWGDGNGEQPVSSFPETGPVYAEIGDYDIKVRAVGANGCTNTFETVFSVGDEPEAVITEEGTQTDPDGPAPEPGGKQRRPVPEEGDKGCEPIIVPFKSESTGGGLTYTWEITPQQPQGLGPDSWEVYSGGLEEESLEIKFNLTGIYLVKLTVDNECGEPSETEQTVVIGYPLLSLNPEKAICGPGQQVSYSSGGTGGGEGVESVSIDPNFGTISLIRWTVTFGGTEVATGNNESFSYTFGQIGTYTVRIYAENECGNSDFQGPITQTVTVYPPLDSEPTVTTPPVSCPGGTVSFRATGPAAGVRYRLFDAQIDGNLVAEADESGRFEIPAPPSNRDYFVEAYNEVCESPRARVTVTVVPEIVNIIETVEGVCAGDRPAEITGNDPSEQGGTGYLYTWEFSTTGPTGSFATAPSGSDNPSNGQNYRPNALSETTWFRRVVRLNNCDPSISNVVEVQAVPRITGNATVQGNQDVCAGAIPTQLTGATPEGGNGNLTIEWQFSTTGATATDYAATSGNNSGANYVFTQPISTTTWFRRSVTSGGCTVVSEPVVVTVVPEIERNDLTATQQEVCTGTTPGAITGSAPTGGTGTYTYEWQVSVTGSDGPYTLVTNATGRDYTPGALTQTSWFKRIVRSGNCPEDESNVVEIRVITVTAQDNSIQAAQPQVCTGSVPGQLTGTPISGVTFRWESSISGPTAGFNPAPGTNSEQNYTPPALTRDTWFRRVAIVGSCENASEVVQLQVQAIPSAPILTVQDARACVGGSATLTVANANGNSIEWFDTPTGGSPLFVGTTFVTPELNGNTTFYVQARNNNNCTNATRTTVNVTVVEPVADAGPDVEIIQGRPAELRASGGVSYQWEPAASLSNANVSNPVARPDVTTTYTVTITTEEGCTATDEVTVTVIPAITAPNAFSPNGDRVNDVWEIENIQNYPDARVEIFNRWGNQIFNSTGYATPWDGTYNGESLPVATYYYIIYLNSSEKPISGHVTIIR
ncbi:gliding motility-associated C-terminal domain-containing protein [uncultured Pontibacter sp.]|uniref:Ig-like domain-containing protein n=1 Tax=uncultured Pontibacter sp. TaxID=453356 RepID=UPI0026340B87|nr:gliding motility-associated C-terminal domain-containing protein [uncultured Pontibacter sp.]